MALPAPASLRALPRTLLAEVTTHRPEPEVVADCVALLGGADPGDHADLLPYLAGRPGVSYLAGGWTEADYWPRVWGARGLLYVWDESATPAVLTGLRDQAWRVAEMCLKVCAARDVAPGGDVVPLTGHELPRVRAAAVRALGATGDTEHLAAVRARLDDPAEEVRRAAARALDRMRQRLDVQPRPG